MARDASAATVSAPNPARALSLHFAAIRTRLECRHYCP